jgi:hypothetical protein
VGFINLPDAKIKYKVAGCRMSGDMNTSSGNCYLMCAMVWYMFERLGLKPCCVNNGDDCVLFVERADAARLADSIPAVGLQFGFTMVVEKPVSEFSQIEFCQSRPVLVGDEWIMVRNPWVATAKDTCMKHPDPCRLEKSYRVWLGAVADCGIALTGGVPVFQPFYQALDRQRSEGKVSSGSDFQRTGLAWQSAGMSRSIQPILAPTRYYMWLAWGILPDVQTRLESEWSQWSIAGERFQNPGLSLTAYPITKIEYTENCCDL